MNKLDEKMKLNENICLPSHHAVERVQIKFHN